MRLDVVETMSGKESKDTYTSPLSNIHSQSAISLRAYATKTYSMELGLGINPLDNNPERIMSPKDKVS
jgi:hypothetical protein